jgi:hypothetical protein
MLSHWIPNGSEGDERETSGREIYFKDRLGDIRTSTALSGPSGQPEHRVNDESQYPVRLSLQFSQAVRQFLHPAFPSGVGGGNGGHLSSIIL